MDKVASKHLLLALSKSTRKASLGGNCVPSNAAINFLEGSFKATETKRVLAFTFPSFLITDTAMPISLGTKGWRGCNTWSRPTVVFFESDKGLATVSMDCEGLITYNISLYESEY